MCLCTLAAHVGRREPKPHDLLRGRHGGSGGLGGFLPDPSSELDGRRGRAPSGRAWAGGARDVDTMLRAWRFLYKSERRAEGRREEDLLSGSAGE
eukprot:763724-Hanusia_phi.AAC.9